MASASYITGSHAIKTGMTMRLGHQLADVLVQRADQHASTVCSTPAARQPVPCTVACPSRPRQQRSGDGAAEGEQRLRHLRAGHLDDEPAHAEPRRPLRPLQRRSAGAVVGGRPPGSHARDFAAIPNVPNWNDWSVRFAGAYDLFGTGKTAIKANASKYIASAAAGYAQNFNGMTYCDADARAGSTSTATSPSSTPPATSSSAK